MVGNDFIDNAAGGQSEDRDGGGLAIVDSLTGVNGEASVDLLDNRFSGNTTPDSGGAVYLDVGAPVTIDSTVFDGNSAEASGGAVAVAAATSVTVTRSAFIGNDADLGGAIAVLETGIPLTVTDSTFHANTADVASAIAGDTDVDVEFITLLDQDDPFDIDGDLSVTYSAIGQVTGCGDLDVSTGNIVADADCAGDDVPDLDVSDAFSPWYFVPAAESPLVGSGDTCTSTDQRGKPRDASDCAVGAVEHTTGLVCPEGPLPRGEAVTCSLDTGLAGRTLAGSVVLNPTLFAGPVALDGDGAGEITFEVPEDVPGDIVTVTASSGDLWFDQEVQVEVEPIVDEPTIEPIADEPDEPEELPATGLDVGGGFVLGLLLMLLGSALVRRTSGRWC